MLLSNVAQKRPAVFDMTFVRVRGTLDLQIQQDQTERLYLKLEQGICAIVRNDTVTVERQKDFDEVFRRFLVILDDQSGKPKPVPFGLLVANRVSASCCASADMPHPESSTFIVTRPSWASALISIGFSESISR